MTTNSQISTTESKKTTKQTTRSGTESQKVEGENGDNKIRSIIGRHKIDRGKLRIV